jgi:hypothetical protein
MAIGKRVTADNIASRADFVRFVRGLIRDLDETGDGRLEGWGNATLRDYLEALAAWTGDMDGYFQHRGEPVPETPSWRLVGEMLAAAATYE